jgi:hypothetical protein
VKHTFLIIFFILLSTKALSQTQQDIILKSRFDLESSEVFINRLRVFLKNNKFGDPYNQEIKKPIVIDLLNLLNDMPEDTQLWLRDLQNVIRLSLFESNYRMIIEDFSYQIDDFNSEFMPGKSSAERVEYVTINYVKGIRLKATRIIFEVELNRTQSGAPIKFKVELLSPEFIISPELQTELSMGWGTSILPQNVLITLESIDISKVLKRILISPDLIDLQVQDMVIPDISVKIGQKEVKLDRQKIKRFFSLRKRDMKKGILDLLKSRMSDFTNIVKGNTQELKLPRSQTFEADFNGILSLQEMTVNKTGIVQYDLDGLFCQDVNQLKINFCREGQIEVKRRRVIDIASYQKSLREMNRNLIERKTNIALSISEDYLNQLIEVTIRNGLWEDALKESDFQLGPEKSFILAEEKGGVFSLYLDIIYKLKGSERILVGRSQLRFPVKLKIELKVEDIQGTPHFTIVVKNVDTEAKLLVNGLPQYDLLSTVGTVPRFRNKVISRIMNDVSNLNGKTLIDFELKLLEGTYLHEMEFASDGLGRGNATIGFKSEKL